MKAFITGSNAYGIPTEASDIDLVVRCDPAVAALLKKHSDTPEENKGVVVVRFGKLNAIVCTDDVTYATWLMGTEQMLIAKRENLAPTNRDDAKKIFDHLRGLVGLNECLDSQRPEATEKTTPVVDDPFGDL